MMHRGDFNPHDSHAAQRTLCRGPTSRVHARHNAGEVALIFKGTRPGEIPYYQGTKFFLAINLKTATALGLTIPDKMLTVADEVIE